MTTPQKIIATARAMVGVRFQHQGRDATHGLDCLGLLLVVAEQLNLRFEGIRPMALDVRNYRTRPDTKFLYAQLSRWLQPIATDEVKIADIVLLEIHGLPQHLALLSDYPVVGEMGMIHAHAIAHRVVEHRYDESWRKATIAAFRLPQITPFNETGLGRDDTYF